MSEDVRTKVGCGDGDTYIASDYHVGYREAEAKWRGVVEMLVEALNWSRVMLKFHVAPERCVDIGDNVKSCIALYKEIHEALAQAAELLGRK